MYSNNPGDRVFKKSIFQFGRIPHYYGDRVRAILIVISMLLMGAMLVDWQLLAFYLVFGVVGMLALVVLAGLTSPRSRRVLVAEGVVCAVGFVVFEYAAVLSFSADHNFSEPVFILRQLLALLFMIALYYSIKSVRGVIRPVVREPEIE